MKNVFKWAFKLCNFRQQYFFALFRCINCYNNLCLSIDITYLDIIQLIICSFKLNVIFRFHYDVFQVQPGIVNGALNLMSFWRLCDEDTQFTVIVSVSNIRGHRIITIIFSLFHLMSIFLSPGCYTVFCSSISHFRGIPLRESCRQVVGRGIENLKEFCWKSADPWAERSSCVAKKGRGGDVNELRHAKKNDSWL